MTLSDETMPDETMEVNVFAHCCTITANNCYVIGSDMGPEVVVVDPGYLDETLLMYIENNDFQLKGILVTHDHTKLQGIQSLKRIYDAPVYAVTPYLYGYKTVMLRDRDIINVGPFCFEVLLIPGHTYDSAVFKIGHILFTGDALSAGLLGYTSSAYSATSQINALQSKIFSLLGDMTPLEDVKETEKDIDHFPENFTVFPCHGPPTSLKSEQLFNAGIQQYEKNKNRLSSVITDYRKIF
jgi:glyoxylase-like metal-dependent hydrolase (beta-lactamase superfamily II)